MARKAYALRIDAELLDELRHWADSDLRSLNAQIEWLLRQAVAKRKGRADLTEPPQDEPAGE